MYRKVSHQIDGPRSGLFSTLFDYRFGGKAVQHGVWKNLIEFAHGYRNKKLPSLLNYQKNSFALPTSHEAWIQLYPLPSPHNHAWYYSWLHMPKLAFLKSRILYQKHLYEKRTQTILQKISAHKPDIVLLYGMENINGLKKSVIDFFPKVKFKSHKAIKLLMPQYHQTEINGTTLLITTQIPALRHNRIETGFNWEEFGKNISSEEHN